MGLLVCMDQSLFEVFVKKLIKREGCEMGLLETNLGKLCLQTLEIGGGDDTCHRDLLKLRTSVVG